MPRYNVYGDIGWRYPALGFSTGLELRWQGNVPVNDSNTEFANSYFVAAVRGGFEQRTGDWRFTEFARVDNMFNELYIGAVYVNDGNGRFYAPAAERYYTVGVSASYKF